MPFSGVHDYFNPDDMVEMLRAFRAACYELGLSNGERDKMHRDRLAKIIVEIAKRGKMKAEELQSEALARRAELGLPGGANVT